MLREQGPEPEALPTDDDSVRSAARTDVAGPRAAVLGHARARGRPRRGLPPPRHPRAVQAALGRARREGRRLARARRGATSCRAWSACGASRTTCSRARCSATSLPPPWATAVEVYDPEDHERVLETFVFPRQPGHDRLCIADFYRPEGRRRARRRRLPGRHRRPAGHRADGRARARRRVRRAALRPRPRRPDRRGHGRVAALARPRATSASRRPRAGAGRGATRPARSSPSTRSSSGCIDAPSASACSCPAATPSSPSSRRSRSSPTTREAVYFGMKSGSCCRRDKRADDVIRGSDRDPTLRGRPGGRVAAARGRATAPPGQRHPARSARACNARPCAIPHDRPRIVGTRRQEVGTLSEARHTR